VRYYVRSSLQGLWRQYWQYGIYKGTFLRAYPASIKFRHLVPPLFVLAITAGTVLTAISQAALLALAITVGIYAVFVLAAVVTLCRRGKLNYAPIMPLVLACLHFSYGIGIWLGLVAPKVPRHN
jgi:predicted permease